MPGSLTFKQGKDTMIAIGYVLCSEETELALKCELYDDVKWIPKHEIATISPVKKKGDFGKIFVTEFYAQNIGWV